jgi:general secretion pathway protein E
MHTQPDPIQSALTELGARLCASGKLDPAQLERAARAAEETADRLDRVLCRLGLIEERDVTDALSQITGLERVGPEAFPDEPAFADELGPRFLKSARLAPLGERNGRIRLAISDPLDRAAVDAVALRLGRLVEPVLATAADVEAALERLYDDADDAVAAEDAPADAAEDVAKLKDLASEAPVIRIVNGLIRKAVEAKASDIHIEPADTGFRVRIRVDGALQEIDSPPANLRAAIVSRLKIMAGLNIAEQRLPQDGRLQATVAGREIDIRMATAPTLHGEGVVLRLLDRSGLVLDFAGLGFDQRAKDAFLPLIERPNGILLVTGPTGSGKTTTLYAALNHINGPDRKIITIEDPVEYQLDGVTQLQVRSQIDFTFARGLRSILRLDPDVIMIGEIRDAETAQIAVQAALTGHLVLATLHTNSAASAASRLRDMGVDDYLITATLIGVLSQRLARRLCGNCAGPADPGLTQAMAPGLDPVGVRTPTGCAACRHTGYRGRTGLMEVLSIDDPIRRAILDRRDDRAVEDLARQAGMRSLRDHGLEAAARGETSLAEVARLAADI